MKSKNKNICISIPITTNEYIRKFVLDNSYMFNIIRNDFAEEANKHKGDYNMYDDFDPWEFLYYYHNVIESPRKDESDRYRYFCVGLSEQVADNFRSSRKIIRTQNRKVFKHKSSAKLGEYHYKKFDFNNHSFKVNLKTSINKKSHTIRSRLKILDANHITFRVRSNKYDRTKEVLNITLNERLYDDIKPDILDPTYIRYYKSNGKNNRCTFKFTDIKNIAFVNECGNYYILLYIEATYRIDKGSREYSEGKVAGIDTGIRHPMTIYDGNKVMYISMDDKIIRRIRKIEYRIKRLQHYKNLKIEYNRQHGLSTHSNNIIKLVKKIKRLYRKITNIKNHWAKNIAKQITTTYEAIVVDTFEQPDKKTKEGLPKKVIRSMNYANRFHKMYYVNEFIKHDCDKYGCKYIESPDNSTRTCSICGHVNSHLPLTEKYLTCKCCNSVIERDANAAKNCYAYA